MPVPRFALLSIVAQLVLLLGLGACTFDGDGFGSPLRSVGSPVAAVPKAPGQPSKARAGELRPTVRALGVLRRWDRLRAAAYASGDVGALRRLYSPASWAGARDVGTLRQYAERGLVVQGLRMQVLDAEVLPAAPGRLRLRVVERLTGAVTVAATMGRMKARLPAGRPVARTITFVRVGERWVVRSVRRS